MDQFPFVLSSLVAAIILGITLQLVQLLQGRLEDKLCLATMVAFLALSHATMFVLYPHWVQGTVTVIGQFVAFFVAGMIVQRYTWPIIKRRVAARGFR